MVVLISEHDKVYCRICPYLFFQLLPHQYLQIFLYFAFFLAGKKIQQVINAIFSEFRSTEPFKEFSQESNRELSDVLLKLDEHYTEAQQCNNDIAKSLKAIAIFTIEEITKKNLHPSLVKLALGIFLTHNKDAQKLGVVPPAIKYHSEFSSLTKTPISNPVTADTMKGVEILAYFREDYEFNDHHYHWHMVYPYSGHVENKQFKRTIDRQGELFLYMHSQMIARYNTELLSWGLDMTHAWGYDDILTFGYDPVPNIRDLYGARPPYRGWFEDHNPKISEQDADGFPPKAKMIHWRDNIFNAITNGYFETTKEGKPYGQLKLTPDNAANWVGVVVEAENKELQEVLPNSGEFIDREKYGNVHNLGHDKFAEIGYHLYTSDKNPLDVMISNIGSPRDPCFWLWHRHIDDFRQAIVKKYTQSLEEFQPKGLMIDDLKILSRDSAAPSSMLKTFLGPPQLHNNEANARIDHEPYQWEVTVSSTDANHDKSFIVRIFIAPAVLIQDQRSWIEMDKFNATLCSGSQTYIRKDTESSVARKEGDDLDPRCRCGWPQNMMLPIGTPEGMDFVGFAMLTTGQLDPVSCFFNIS